MEDKKINGTSICIIDKWVTIIETQIKSKQLYVKTPSQYIADIVCHYNGEEKDKENLLFLQKDVAILLVMLHKIFPDIFHKLNNIKSCPYFIIERNNQVKYEYTESITNKICLVRDIIALSK